MIEKLVKNKFVRYSIIGFGGFFALMIVVGIIGAIVGVEDTSYDTSNTISEIESSEQRDTRPDSELSIIQAESLYGVYELNKVKFIEDFVGLSEDFIIEGKVELIDENVDLCGKNYDYIGCGIVEMVTV